MPDARGPDMAPYTAVCSASIMLAYVQYLACHAIYVLHITSQQQYLNSYISLTSTPTVGEFDTVNLHVSAGVGTMHYSV